MILALIKAQCISLLRDRMAMLLTFALPCVMFTVFAIIFGGSSKVQGTNRLKVIVLDQDQSRSSRRLVDGLKAMDKLEVTMLELPSAEIAGREASENPVSVKATDSASASNASHDESRKQAAVAVRSGKAAAAVILPNGLEASMAEFGNSNRPAIELIYDPANPLAEQMLAGVLQASAFTSSPDILMEKGLEQFRSLGGPFSPLQETAAAAFKMLLSQQGDPENLAAPASAEPNDKSQPASEPAAGQPSASGFSMTDGIVRIESHSARDVVQSGDAPSSQITSAKMISYYAAGISVMFVMFSMSGAASSLLEHEERGTLERLLSGRMTIIHLLLSHWIFYVGLGVVQISLMFLFASVVFGLDLWHLETLAGAGVMATVSSMASAAFIMMIATLCKSRKQLEGLSSIVILIMSAVGGSMMPRFIMPAFVLKLSSVAFNAWAMDGFLKVFWYNTPDQSILGSIVGEVAVILAMAAAFLSVAFIAAQRWAVR